MPIAMLIISGKSRIQEVADRIVGAWSNVTDFFEAECRSEE